jgi:ABC-2 type transport system ATP-binding protein
LGDRIRVAVTANNHNQPAFRLQGLAKTFFPFWRWQRAGAVEAVRGIDLEVTRGSIFSLLGPNGAGKTTTIKMIAGLILPTRGSVKFYDRAGNEQRTRPRLGAVLEGSRNLYWRLSPMENLLYFGDLKGLPRSQVFAEARELLEMFDLGSRAKSATMTLSRGMQQKVAVAVALLGKPDIMLLDEPTLGLDVESSRLIQQRLRELVRDGNRTIVLTTHQMELAARVSDRVGIISQGSLIAEDSLANLTAFFRRQDYCLELSAAEWDRLRPEVPGFKWTQTEGAVDGEVKITFHLESQEAFFPLAENIAALKPKFQSFEQVTPSLEDIFLEITQHYPVGKGGAQ